MDRIGCRKIVLLLAVLALALAAGSQVALAQAPCGGVATNSTPNPPPCTDAYTVDYFANAHTTGAPDGIVRVINPGTTSAPNPTSPTYTEGGHLCALIYVFDNTQEMAECCGCFVSANALLTLSVNANLTGNPLLGNIPPNCGPPPLFAHPCLTTGVIKIVASHDPGFPTNPCNPTTMTPTRTLRAWATHIQGPNTTGAKFPTTEGESQAATLGQGEAADLAEDCAVIGTEGFGQGICTCPPGH